MEFYFEKFKAIREHKNISVKEISISLNKHRVTVWAWEKGKQKPCLSDIRELAKILHIDLADISDIRTEIFNKEENWNITDDINSPLSIEDRLYIEDMQSELTAQRKYINTLKREKKELENIVNNVQTLIYKKDSHLRYSFINTAFQNTIQLSIYDLIGKNNYNLFTGKEVKTIHALEQRILRGEKITNYEIVIPGTKGKRKGYFSGNPMYHHNSTISGIAVSIEDITDKSIAVSKYKQLEDAVNFSQDVLWIKDRNKKNSFSFISNSIDKITRYKIKHFHNNFKFWRDTVVHPEAKKRVSEFYEKRNWENPIDYKIITADGKTKYLREKCYFENGMQFGVIEDRTSKTEAEKYKMLLLDIINKIPSSIWVSEDNGKNLSIVTDACEDYLSVPKSYFIKNSSLWLKYIYPDDLIKYSTWREGLNHHDWWKSKAKKTKSSFLNYRIIKDNKIIWIKEIVYFDPELRKKGIRYGVMRDVTDEIKKSTVLRILENVIDKANNLVWICTPPPDARYLYISDAVEKIWGRPIKDFKNNVIKWLDFIHPDDREAEREAIEKDEFPMFRTYRIIRPDGSVRKLQSSSFRDIDENGNIVDFGIIRDITEKHN